ncbi:MAG: putative phosphoesterase [Rhodothermales bacterium]|jgi:putative phosphoesterase
MRYAIVSDIHANWQAWQAVIRDIRSIGVDCIICLGDVVGYGPHPAKVTREVRENCENFVLGNHDAVVAGFLDPAIFNKGARQIIQWTAKQLDEEAVQFYASLPMVLEAENFICVHAEVARPQRFGYIVKPEDARDSFAAADRDLVFVGHTHKPGVFTLDPETAAISLELSPEKYALRHDRRYIVNVGSVGDPRDGDMRSAYCLYDDSTKTISIRRIPFDIRAYADDLEAAQLPMKPRFLFHLLAEEEAGG